MAARQQQSVISHNNLKISNLPAPTLAQDAANKTYVDTADTTEQTARIAADTTLTTRIAAEETSRGAADTAIEADVMTRVLRAGDTMTGHLSVPSLSTGTTIGEKSFYSSFTSGVANQKQDIYFTTGSGTSLNGFLDVWIVAGGTYAGVVSKRYALALAGSTATYNFARYTEVMGTVPVQFALSDLVRDTTNNRWRVQLSHRTTQAVDFGIVLQVFSGDSAVDVKNLLPTFGLSSTYSNDTNIFPEPIVWFERLFIAQGSTSSFDIPTGSTYNIQSDDSIILAASGATVVLPSAITAGQGRSYIVKNIGTSGVTVTAAAGQIDAASSMAIGNRSYATFMSDGTNWWRVS